MPTIEKRKQVKRVKCINEVAAVNEQQTREVYNSTRWQKLRRVKLMMNPLCEMCERKGIVKEAEEVHHIVSINVDLSQAFDLHNIMSVCKICHQLIHNKKDKRGYGSKNI